MDIPKEINALPAEARVTPAPATNYRVLHIVGRMDRAGAETVIMDLYRRLDRDRFQFDFLVFTNDKCDYDDEIEKLGGRIFRLPYKGPGHLLRRFFALTALLRRHSEIQIVHSHVLLASALFLLAAALAGVRTRIAHSHNTDDSPMPSQVRRWYRSFSVFMLHHLVTVPVSCGEAAAEYLFPQRRDVFLLSNSIDLDRFIKGGDNNPKHNVDVARQGDSTLLEILQVGRLEPVKNHQFTLRVAHALLRRGVNFRLSLIGRGSLEDEIRAGIRALGLVDHVFMLGLRADVPELMRRADVMLMPSLFEGMPVVMVEAQAVGLSCVVSDRISREVDVGLGLVRFLPILDASDWSEELIKQGQRSRLSATERLKALRERGYDAASNIHRLEAIYTQNVRSRS